MANFKIIRELCKSKKIELKELAEKVGISKTALYELIDRGSTKTEILEKIANVLDVDISIFFKSDYIMPIETGKVNEADLKDKYIKLLEEKVKSMSEKEENKIETKD